MKPLKIWALGIKFVLLCILVPIVLKGQTNQTVAAGMVTAPINFPAGNCAYSWTNTNPSVGIPSGGTGNIPSFIATNNTNAPVTATFIATPIPKGFAYIPNSTSGTVSVINTYTKATVSTIPIGKAPIGVAISKDDTRVYITDIITGNISFIDAATNTVSAVIPGASAPMGVAVTPDGKYIYVANSQSNDVWKINTATQAITTIPMGHPSEVMVMKPDGDKVYAIHSNVVSVINTATDAVLNNIAIDPVIAFSAVISRDGNYLYIGSTSLTYIQVVNTAANSVSQMLILRPARVTGMAISPDGSTLYASLSGVTITSDGVKLDVQYTGLSTVVAINTNFQTAVSIGIVSPASLSLSSDGRELYITHKVSAQDGRVAVVNTSNFFSNSFTADIPIGTDPIPIGNFVGDLVSCGPPITYTITVNPASNAGAGNTTSVPSSVNTVYGTESLATSFIAPGTGITAGTVITPPAGFEVSTDKLNYSNTITIGAGVAPSDPVYIRLKKTTPAGTYSGNIILKSAGAADVNIVMPVSTVIPARLTVTADNESKNYGEANPPLTITYTGFVNGEGAGQLTTRPIVVTTATLTSPVGQYPIMVSGGVSSNYTFIYVNGVLTVNPPPIIIPNTFTPNGDGINDTWNIVNINNYSKITVQIMNRYGTRIYFSNGYPVPWDGNYKGSRLPAGVYYYIITGVAARPMTGHITVLR